jgi:hypothetical protein
MGGAAERRAACGRKNKNKHEPSFSGKTNMSPVFQEKKPKDLRSRVFLATLLVSKGHFAISINVICVGIRSRPFRKGDIAW